MCGFYSNGEKIKEGDIALCGDEKVVISKAVHLKENKTMDIRYKSIKNDKEDMLNFPYKTTTTMKLLQRMDTNI